jgi:hypothetical protein
MLSTIAPLSSQAAPLNTNGFLVSQRERNAGRSETAPFKREIRDLYEKATEIKRNDMERVQKLPLLANVRAQMEASLQKHYKAVSTFEDPAKVRAELDKMTTCNPSSHNTRSCEK